MSQLSWLGVVKYRIEPEGEVEHWYYFSGHRPEDTDPGQIAGFKDYNSHQARELIHGDWLTATEVPADLRKHFYRGVLRSLDDIEAIQAKLVAILARGRSFRHELVAEFRISLAINDDTHVLEIHCAELKVSEGGWMPSTMGGVPTCLRSWQLWPSAGHFEVNQHEKTRAVPALEDQLGGRLTELDEHYGLLIEPLLTGIVTRFEPEPK